MNVDYLEQVPNGTVVLRGDHNEPFIAGRDDRAGIQARLWYTVGVGAFRSEFIARESTRIVWQPQAETSER